MNDIDIDFKFLDGQADHYEQAIELCTSLLYSEGYIKSSFLEACLQREQSFPTGLPLKVGVAIPHAGSDHVKKSCLCLLRLAKPVRFHRIDAPEQQVDVTFVVCIAIASPNSHSAVLAQLIKTFQDDAFTADLEQKMPGELVDLFKARLAG